MTETKLPLVFDDPVTIAGDGVLDAVMLAEAQAVAPHLVAADGAADRLAAFGLRPEAVVGDMDSIGEDGHAAAARVFHLPEQETTDFEKCLYATEAPLYVAVGFIGGRLDHTLATLHALLTRPDKRVVLLGEADAAALLPARRAIRLELPARARVSIYPLAPLTGSAEGLRWPVDGLAMAAGERIGTSNEALGGTVTLRCDGPGGLLLLERHELKQLAHAIAADPPAV